MSEATTPITIPTDAATAAQDASTITANLLSQVTAKWGTTDAAMLAPLVTQYGPVLAAMTATEVWNYLSLAIGPNSTAAYQVLVSKMQGQTLVDQWAVKINPNLIADVNQNAANVAAQKNIAGAFASTVAKGCAMILLAMVGF